MKKCMVIPDSFKGSMSSEEICKLAAEQINLFFPQCETLLFPIADGGEGTVASFLSALSGESVPVVVSGPYGEQLASFYGRFGATAVIEMAAAAGLPLVEGKENPAVTTTYGVGELIKHAILHGATEIIVGLGGSCTNDGGCGCAAALGVEFFNQQGIAFLPVGYTLDQIDKIDLSKANKLLQGVDIIGMWDVDHPMHGEDGAAYVFAPQKKADEAMVKLLDCQLQALDKIIVKELHKEVGLIPGSGAAGAMGAGLLAFMDAQLQSGIETVLDVIEFDTHLENCDAVFTGEGRIDGQSIKGKVISGVAKRAHKQSVPVFVLVGDIAPGAEDAYDLGVTAMFSINRRGQSYTDSREQSPQNFSATLGDLLRVLRSGNGNKP